MQGSRTEQQPNRQTLAEVAVRDGSAALEREAQATEVAAPHAAQSPISPTRPRAALWVLLLVYFAITAAYNVSIPVGEAPDEPSHIQYAEILLDTGQLPTFDKDSPRFNYEAHQPPLYYLLQAGWIGLLWPGDTLLPDLTPNPDFTFATRDVPNAYLHTYPASDAVPAHLMRLLSTLIGALTLLFIWLAARLVWPDDWGAAVVALGFAALLPGFSFSSSIVTNDALAACTGAAAILAALHLVRRGVTLRVSALAGLAVGLGILSKASMLAMLPLLALVYLLAPAPSWSARLKGGALAFAVALAIGIWPSLYNLSAYGDPFATAAFLEVDKSIASPLKGQPVFWLAPWYIVGLFNSLWGVFGLRNVEMAGAIYLFYYTLALAALFGLIYGNRRAAAHERIALLVLLAAFALTYAALAQVNTQVWAVQGRLLLPAFAALALLIGRGLSLLAGWLLPSSRARAYAAVSLLVLLAALDCYALVRYILGVYYV